MNTTPCGSVGLYLVGGAVSWILPCRSVDGAGGKAPPVEAAAGTGDGEDFAGDGIEEPAVTVGIKPGELAVGVHFEEDEPAVPAEEVEAAEVVVGLGHEAADPTVSRPNSTVRDFRVFVRS